MIINKVFSREDKPKRILHSMATQKFNFPSYCQSINKKWIHTHSYTDGRNGTDTHTNGKANRNNFTREIKPHTFQLFDNLLHHGHPIFHLSYTYTIYRSVCCVPSIGLFSRVKKELQYTNLTKIKCAFRLRPSYHQAMWCSRSHKLCVKLGELYK